MRQKNFDRKSWYSLPPPPPPHPPPPPSYSWIFSIPEILWNTEGFAYEVFRYCETTNFWQKIVILPPSSPSPSSSSLLFINFFDTRIIVKHRRVRLRSFSVLWDNKFSEENRDIPLICIKFFDTRNYWNTEGFPYENFWHCETKIFQGKIVIPFCIKYRNQWWNWCL